MKFLGNKPPPLYHKQILKAVKHLSRVDESFPVAGVPQPFVTQWLARCWRWERVDGKREFYRA